MAKSLLNNTADDRGVWIALGQMDIRLRRWKDAEDALNKAEPLTTKKEDRTYLLFLRGELAERQKHFEPAEQFFRQVLDLDPANAMTLNYLGYMLADKGVRLPEALKMIRKAVELEPVNGAYLDSLGWVYFKMGEYELAEDNLRQAVERDQTDPTVHEHLGDLYEKTGRIRLAAAQWELSLAEFAKSAPADVEPGDVAKVQKKLESARVKLAKQDSSLGAGKAGVSRHPKPQRLQTAPTVNTILRMQNGGLLQWMAAVLLLRSQICKPAPLLARRRGNVDIHIVLVHQRRARIHKHRIRREGIGAVVLVELRRRIVEDLVQRLQSDVAHRVGLLRDGRVNRAGLDRRPAYPGSHPRRSPVGSAPLTRVTASETGLPDAESRHTNASIFLGPVSARYSCVLSNAVLRVALDVHHVHDLDIGMR